MPLVQYYKGRRSRQLKGRPVWQDLVPDDPELRQSYRIAADNEEKFSRAFLAAQRSMLDDKTKTAIKRAWREGGSLQAILNLLPNFSAGEDDPKVYQRLVDKLFKAYFDVISESGQDAMKRLNKGFKTDFRFRIMNEEGEVMKARKRRRRGKVRVPVVPVNPYSIDWMKRRSLELVTQGITATQMDVVTHVLTDGFERGLRAEAVMDELEQNIGLTTREFNAVQNRRLLHQQAGLPSAKVTELTDKYSAKLLKGRAKRIARTETIQAQAQGRNTAWRMAQESGQLPAVERVWASPPPSSDPNAPCEICEELDGKTANIGEPYESLYLGAIMHPTAHPN